MANYFARLKQNKLTAKKKKKNKQKKGQHTYMSQRHGTSALTEQRMREEQKIIMGEGNFAGRGRTG